MPQQRTDSSSLPEGSRLRPVGLTPQEEDSRREYSRYQQTLACFSAMLTMVAVGTVYGWSMTCLRSITSGIGYVPLMMGQDEYSLICALIVFGSMIGSFLGAHLADRIGRKNCLLLCSAIITTGWLIIYVANSVRVLYLAQVIQGIGVGIARTINPMYVSEVADICLRGKLGVLITLTAYTGTIITSALEFWLSYELFLGILIIISTISFVLNTCFPETPYFLVAKGRKKRACKSLAYYKGILDPNEAKIELRALREQTKYELYPQSRYEVIQQPRSDLLSQSRTNLPSQSRSNLPSQSTSNLPSQSRSNLPPQSIHERLSDPTQVVDTEPMPDSHLPSSSNVPSTFEIHSEVVRDVRQQPTGELREQASRDAPQLALHPSRALYSQSTSESHRPSRSNLRSQPNVDSRASPDMDEIHMDGTKCTGFTKLRVILHRSNMKALFLMLALIMSQQFSKHFITMQYPEKLYREAKIVNDAYSATLMVQLINVLSISYTMFKVEYHGRRKFLMVSILWTTLTLSALAYHFLMAEQTMSGSISDIIILIILVIYQAMFQSGLGTIPTVLLCELFPMELTGFIVATMVLFDGTIGFIVSKLYEVITDSIEENVVYLLFATSNILTYTIVFTWMPETKGKTYNEIRALLIGNIVYSSNEDVTSDESDIHSL